MEEEAKTEFSPTQSNVVLRSIVVSIGEPAGIGPDIIVEAWSRRQTLGLPHFTVIGDAAILEQRNKLLGLNVPVHRLSDSSDALACDNALPVIQTENRMNCAPGKAVQANSAAVIEAIERGVDLVISGEFAALTTCPINKKALYDSGFAFPGHTEYLAFLSNKITGEVCRPVMMLAGPDLRSVPVTVHIALNQVKQALDRDSIVETARITAHDLRQKLQISDPVLAIAGVNPHAGEDGAMGTEEIEIIRPAIEILQKEGINAIGPLPADTMFHQRAREAYDVAICMYHDQALIPAKTLAFDDAVNVTLGLPFVRTSPDHGTAYDLAGTGKAKASSFVAALKMADEMSSHFTQAKMIREQVS